ncbi:MAG TPA: hypothetical protein VLY63_11645 [Anaerolineae bacterium]|nr:hypothetical protein [Anaerolineae bacterium]
MGRADGKRLEAIWRTVEEKPGIKAGRVSRELGLAWWARDDILGMR